MFRSIKSNRERLHALYGQGCLRVAAKLLFGLTCLVPSIPWCADDRLPGFQTLGVWWLSSEGLPLRARTRDPA
jgi:hypothetical protein